MTTTKVLNVRRPDIGAAESLISLARVLGARADQLPLYGAGRVVVRDIASIHALVPRVGAPSTAENGYRIRPDRCRRLVRSDSGLR